MQNELGNSVEKLYGRITHILDNARNTVYKAANFEMLKAYWEIGQAIVEGEQQGKDRAEYGAALLEGLSMRLTEKYGKNFSNRNLRYMRQFYMVYQKWNAVRSELTWTHYRLLLRVEKDAARAYYSQEAIEGNWGTRTLR